MHQSSLRCSFPFLISYNWSIKFSNCVWIWLIPTAFSPMGEASNFMVISQASLCVTIFYYINGSLIWDISDVMNHSLCWMSLISKLTLSISVLNLWSKSQTVSFGYCLIYFSSVMYCASDFGFLNSSISPLLTFANVFAWVLVGTCTNFINSCTWSRN